MFLRGSQRANPVSRSRRLSVVTEKEGVIVEDSSSKEQGAFSVAYRYYALGLLVVVYVFNFIDRSILGILVEPIKRD